MSACADHTTYQEFEIVPGKGNSVITDAKQRVFANIDIVNKSVSGQVLPRRIVCAEPSPDVAQGISQAIVASLNSSDGTSANFGYSSVAAVAQLGERLATIQLLRDLGYRYCEAYANGAISSTSYTILNSRLTKTMVTLLSAELTAGAFGRELATISGSAKPDSQAESESPNSIPQTEISATAGGIGGDDKPTIDSNSITDIHRRFMEDYGLGTLIEGCLTSLDFKHIDDVPNNPVNESRENSSSDKLSVSEFSGKVVNGKLTYPEDVKVLNYLCAETILPMAADIARKASTMQLETERIRVQSEISPDLLEVIKRCALQENENTPGCKFLTVQMQN